MPDMDFECRCGNPECDAFVMFRKGAVFFRDPKTGKEKSRWDYFYIDAYGPSKKDGLRESCELMLPPEAARRLMWFLIKQFMPGVSQTLWWLKITYRTLAGLKTDFTSWTKGL